MVHVIYRSHAVEPFSHDALRKLLLRSRIRNAEAGVTGMLIYSGDVFLQALEGEELAVQSTLRRISRDPRHDNLVVLARDTDSKGRFYNDWSMGFVDAGKAARSLRGALEVVTTSDLTTLGPADARDLLLVARAHAGPSEDSGL